MSKKSDLRFRKLEGISKLIVHKSWSISGRNIFLVLKQDPPVPSEYQQDPRTLEPEKLADLIVKAFELTLQKLPDLDLETSVRYAMKEESLHLMGVESTDELRLVQAGPECFIFVEKMVKNFRKTDRGYSWQWVR